MWPNGWKRSLATALRPRRRPPQPADRSTRMNTYITLPARYLWGRKTRTILTTLAIVFGVAVIFGVNMLLPSLLSVLNAGEVGATGQAQISINSAGGEAFD